MTVFYKQIKELSPESIPFWLEEHGFPEDQYQLQEDLIAYCTFEKPDYVFFVLMNNEIRIETLDRLNEISKTVNFFCDDQWRFDGFSRNVAPHLHTVITVDKYSVPKYRELGNTRIILTQWAAENLLKYEQKPYRYEVSFVGGRNDVREWYIDELNRRGIFVECFGSGWKNGRVSTERMNEIFQSTKISLNLSNSIPRDFDYRKRLEERERKRRKELLLRILKIYRIKGYRTALRRFIESLRPDKLHSSFPCKNVEQIKARNFEIPAATGFQISQFALEIEDYFVNGREIVLFSTIDELEKLIRYYLCNDIEREKIRLSGYQVASRNLYKARFEAILGALE